jgi:hypothetical protein
MNGLTKTFFGGLFFAIFFSLSTHAATFTVTSVNNAGPGSLRSAIQAAAAGDTIDFNLSSCPCVITLSTSLTINRNLTISGPGADQLTVSGSNAVTVFQMGAPQFPSVTISGLTIANGRTNANGGGVYVQAATLTLSRVVVTNNTAPNTSQPNGFGGGIMVEADASLNLINSTVSNNSSGFGGGGISTGRADAASNLTILGSTISDNAGGITGGGVLLANIAFFTSLNSDYTNNSARGGGGIFVNPSSSAYIRGGSITLNDAPVIGGGGIFNAGTLTMLAVNISNNTTVNADGGGIQNFSELNMTGCTVAGNQSGQLGGGIANVRSTAAQNPQLTVNDSTISGNTTSGDGGGISNRSDTGAGATVRVLNSTISGNRAQGPTSIGGGISNGTNGPTTEVVNSTIAFNTSGRAGGIVNSAATASAFTLRNTILAQNTAPTGPDGLGGFTSQGFNLIGNNRNFTVNAVNSDIVGTTNAPVDPMLSPLGANGGPTQTHFLQAASPAIDKGNAGFGVVTDQRGSIRFFDLGQIANPPGGNGTDIGAVEFQAPTAARVSITGRVLTSNGRTITNTNVALTDATGNVRSARTSSFGYFRFDDIEVGQAYIVAVNSKRYVFQPQVLSVVDEIAELALVVQNL